MLCDCVPPWLFAATSMQDTVVQETKDGELVVLHDLQSLLEASRGYAVNSAVMAELEAQGVCMELPAANVQVTQCCQGISA